MQQINLLNPALIKKSEFLNPNNIALLLGTLLLALLGYAYMESHALSQLEQSHMQIAKQVETAEKQVAEMRAIQASKQDVTVQLKQIQALEQKIVMQKAMIKAIGLNKTGEKPSYAEIFKAFSRQSVDGLWITGLSISQNTEVLSIKGRSSDANLLPTFIANLRQEPALKGKTFTDLTMQSVDKKLSGNHDEASALINAKTGDEKTANTPANNAALQTPPYMEFVLHSVIDKNASAASSEKSSYTAVTAEEKLGLALEGMHP